ncbi:hypothetical protein EGW08_015374 [Elysia chlorotica]|uniref:Uncharacterized protein n=1 Tax=Elysia chlorotica TaxID=188477 RepID=A0A3S0ZE66_ELYCH|nr:hypothetical protein EGW08_015374 [Elysia chlorotica]
MEDRAQEKNEQKHQSNDNSGPVSSCTAVTMTVTVTLTTIPGTPAYPALLWLAPHISSCPYLACRSIEDSSSPPATLDTRPVQIEGAPLEASPRPTDSQPGLDVTDKSDCSLLGKRKVGRPRQTWRRSTDAEARAAGMTWAELRRTSQNRVRWRSVVAALCSYRSEEDKEEEEHCKYFNGAFNPINHASFKLPYHPPYQNCQLRSSARPGGSASLIDSTVRKAYRVSGQTSAASGRSRADPGRSRQTLEAGCDSKNLILKPGLFKTSQTAHRTAPGPGIAPAI